MATVKKSGDRDENRIWWGIRIFFGIIFFILLGSALWGDRSGCGTDKATFACRFTWSLFDVVGLGLFVIGLAWLAGLADDLARLIGFKDGGYVEEGVGTTSNAWIAIVILVIASILIWNF